jgi:hypothetical protein
LDEEKIMPFQSEQQRRYLWAKHPEIAKRWTNKYGSSVKKKMCSDTGWTYVVDKKMKDYGDSDNKKKVIRINPKKGELINTAIHEELHKKDWSLTEKEVDKKAKEKESKLSVKGAIKVLKKYT